jgi:hypothetical protein
VAMLIYREGDLLTENRQKYAFGYFGREITGSTASSLEIIRSCT